MLPSYFSLVLLLILGCPHPLFAQAYTVTDLGTLGGKHSMASAINQREQITGAAETANGKIHAFLYSPEGRQSIRRIVRGTKIILRMDFFIRRAE